MTDQEILTKAIEKALENGWMPSIDQLDFHDLKADIAFYLSSAQRRRGFVFSHDFAKAFWGDKETTYTMHYELGIRYEWQYHLQKMVIEDNPIQYLESYL